MNFLEHTHAVMNAVCEAMHKPPVMTFAWDGEERLTQMGADHFIVHVWTPLALAEGLLRLACGTDDLPFEMAEEFAAAVVLPLGYAQPWTIGSDRIEAWVQEWRRRDG